MIHLPDRLVKRKELCRPMTIDTKRAAILAVLMLAGLQARLYYEKINEYLETYLQ